MHGGNTKQRFSLCELLISWKISVSQVTS